MIKILFSIERWSLAEKKRRLSGEGFFLGFEKWGERGL